MSEEEIQEVNELFRLEKLEWSRQKDLDMDKANLELSRLLVLEARSAFARGTNVLPNLMHTVELIHKLEKYAEE
jgi:hypothetical protein